MSDKVRRLAVGVILLFSITFFVQVIERDMREGREKLQWQSEEKQERENTIETDGTVKETTYRLGLLKNQIVIYKGEDNSIYEYTSLLLEHLPDEERRKVLLGKRFQTEAELYAFLETYSS